MIGLQTGGNSFAYLKFWNTEDGRVTPRVGHVGDFPLFDIDVGVFPPNAPTARPEEIVHFKIDALGVNQMPEAPADIPMLDGQTQTIHVLFSTPYKSWSEELTITPVAGGLARAVRIRDSNGKIVFRCKNDFFPEDLLPEGDWTAIACRDIDVMQ